MKILMAIHHFPPTFTAGAEQVAYQCANGLKKLGHEIRIICVENIHNGSKSGISWEDTVYAGLPVRRLSYETNAFPSQDQFEYDNLWIGEQISRVLSEFRPDIFHLVSGYLITGRSIRIANELGIPTVISLEDFWFLCKRINMVRSNGALSTLPIDPISCVQCLAEQKRRHRIPGSIAPELMRHYWELQKDQIKVVEDRINFQRETLNLANLLMTRSKFLATTYIQAGADPAKLVSFRQGMDASVFPSCIDKKQAVPYLRVGYIGQIAEHKGVHLLVDAIKKLPGIPVSAIMYGNKDAFPYYTRQLLHTANGDRRIEFAGPFHRQDLTKVMANLDILVVPSLCYENSPNVILEAFANQLPVVTSNLGGMAELVQHEKNGLLFKPGSAHDLANQIKRLVEEPELVEKFKQNIPMVKTIDQDVEELVMWYGKLIAKKDAAKVLDEQHSLS